MRTAEHPLLHDIGWRLTKSAILSTMVIGSLWFITNGSDTSQQIQAQVQEVDEVSELYPDSIQQWSGLIEKYAAENGLDPNLVAAVILQESAGKPDAYSKSGAVGLMQVMPRDGLAAGFMCVNGPCFADRPTIDQLDDPEFNVAYGTRMLADLIETNGNVREALKAYGPMDVGYYYADIILNIVNQYD